MFKGVAVFLLYFFVVLFFLEGGRILMFFGGLFGVFFCLCFFVTIEILKFFAFSVD